jgi:hypothetical protein
MTVHTNDHPAKAAVSPHAAQIAALLREAEPDIQAGAAAVTTVFAVLYRFLDETVAGVTEVVEGRRVTLTELLRREQAAKARAARKQAGAAAR